VRGATGANAMTDEKAEQTYSTFSLLFLISPPLFR
jgi:hypothetical protein